MNAPAPVMYVEDDDNDVLLVRRAFKKANVAVPLLVIRNGREAMGYLSGQGCYADRQKFPRPALVLLDLNLRGLSGFDILKFLGSQNDFPKPVVIVFSSSAEKKDIEQARKLGANDYLVKPVDMSAFVGSIGQLKTRWPAEFCGCPEARLPSDSTYEKQFQGQNGDGPGAT